MKNTLEQLQEKCEVAKIKCEILPERQGFTIADGKEVPNTQPAQLVIQIPEARDTARVVIEDGKAARLALGSHFEDYRRLKNLVGIWSSKHKIVECEISTGQTPSLFYYRRASRLIRPSGESRETADPRGITFSLSSETISASITRCSTEHWLLNADSSFGFIRRDESYRPIVFRLEGVNVDQHDQAASIVERAANSVLFSVSLLTGNPAYLKRRPTKNTRPTRQPTATPVAGIGNISRQYDNEAMSLYWYGKTSGQLPLLSFLAFYQVIEFYFPRYSRIEVGRRVKNLLRDPRFDPENDTDIARLLARIRANPHSKTFGDEQSQLMATLAECISADDLREYIRSDEGMLAYYSGRDRSWKKAVDAPINLDSDEIVSEVARRVYRLRCRIVHTKHEDKEVDLLLPFSQEARALTYDIWLVEHLAGKVLIASSTPLSLKSASETSGDVEGG